MTNSPPSQGTHAPVVSSPVAIVAGHGGFAEGLISAVNQITGAGHRFRPVSNSTLGADALVDSVRTVLRETGAQVVFTDLPAGSCTTAARRLAREIPGLTVIAGANLPILLSFALSGSFSGDVLSSAVSKARDALAALTNPTRG